MRTLFAASVALACLAAAPAAQEVPAEAPALADVLQADGRFSVLLGALDAANLTDALAGPGPFTLFAPTDEAFAALPEGTLDALTPDQLQAVLLYHVVDGAVSGAAAADAGEAPTAGNGAVLVFTAVEDGVLRVNDVLVVEADVAARNGVVHVIGGVLLPPPGAAADEAPDDDID